MGTCDDGYSGEDCPACGGPLVRAGVLCRTEWYQCRGCGAWVSFALHETDDPPEDE